MERVSVTRCFIQVNDSQQITGNVITWFVTRFAWSYAIPMNKRDSLIHVLEIVYYEAFNIYINMCLIFS